MELGTRNIVKGRVTDVQKGVLAAEVPLDIGAGRTITSTVTMDRLRALELKIGEEISLLIEATRVGLAKE